MTLQYKLIVAWIMFCAVVAFLWFWHYAPKAEAEKAKADLIVNENNKKLALKDYDINKTGFEVEHKLIDEQILKDIRNDEINLSIGFHRYDFD